MDPFDIAQELEQQQRNDALELQRMKSGTGKPSLKDCADCGDGIPEKRQELGGITRCVECQSLFEKKQKRM